MRAQGHHRRHRRLRRGHGAPAPDGARATGPARASTAQGAEWFALRERLGPSVFTGYDADRDHRPRCWRWSRTARRSTRAEAGETVEVLFDRTPFYAESGGQAGDRGEIDWPGGRAEVLDTQKEAGDLLRPRAEDHRGRAGRGRRACGWRSIAERRARTRLNHSAAHLAHAALQPCAGPARGPEGPAGRRRAHALRLQPRRAAEARRDRPHRGRGERGDPPEPAGRHRGNGAARRPSRPAPWPCSARSTATACACSRLGRALAGDGRLFGGAVRRHPRGAHRRHRPLQDRLRERRRRRACAASRP